MNQFLDCVCEVCRRLDFRETINQARLVSNLNSEGKRESFEYFDVPMVGPDELLGARCPLHTFLQSFFDDHLDILKANPQSFFRLTKQNEDKILWHASQFPQGILRAILAVEPMGLPESISPIFLGPDESDATSTGQWFTSRSVGPTIDYDFLKECMGQCETKHEKCTILKGTQRYPLKVIDLQSKLIVPSPKECRYLALSYVWGKRDEDDTDTVFEIRKLPDTDCCEIVGRIPQAIAGAMEIARGLGERYLWVDALCIDQSNISEKHEEIRNMNGIYKQAMAAIIILEGNSFDTVPGTSVNPRVRKRSAIINDQLFCELPRFWDSVEESVWASRAWTKQEGMLSRRCLVMSRDEVTFVCQKITASESNRLALTDKAIVALPGAVAPNVGRGIHNDFFVHSPHGGFLYDYKEVVGDYSRRQLSFRLDTLNALRGILQNYTERFDTKFLWGLPINKFQEALAWYPLRPEGNQVARRQYGFPTWSWTSCLGPVDFVYSAVTFCQRYGFCAPYITHMPYALQISEADDHDLSRMENQPLIAFHALGIDVDVLVDDRHGFCYISTRKENKKLCKMVLDTLEDRAMGSENCCCVLLFHFAPGVGRHGITLQIGDREIWEPGDEMRCCLILVERIDDTDYRRGIGDMDADAFMAFPLDSKFIRLA